MKKHKPDTSQFVSQRKTIDFDLAIREFKWSEKQKSFIQLAGDKATNVIFLQGPAGSAKTLLAIYAALVALKEKRASELIYIRQAVESSKFNIGYLKGDLQDKLTPYAQPMHDKLNELLSKGDIQKLESDERIICAPVGHMRGRTFNRDYIIVDESQNLSQEDFLLIMTRLGKFSKMIFTGDVMQPDIKNNAFQKIASLFSDETAQKKGIHNVIFNKDDIFRNEVLSFIIERFEELV